MGALQGHIWVQKAELTAPGECSYACFLNPQPKGGTHPSVNIWGLLGPLKCESLSIIIAFH